VSSYTPTLAALLRAQRECERVRGTEPSVLLVSEASAPGLPRLPFVGAEIDAIRAVAIQTGANLTDVITSPSSVAAVTAALPEANIVHFACHGLSDPENALGSGFCLHDGLLSIARIMRLQLKDAFFAFMCACDTT
jgi:CHAT domain-containing protein